MDLMSRFNAWVQGRKSRTFILNDGTSLTLKSMPEFEYNDKEPLFEMKSRGWFIPTKNCKEGDFFVLDGRKYVFQAKSQDGKSDIFIDETPQNIENNN
jgi:hypothetical protein